MPRPRKLRRITQPPRSAIFKPAGIPLNQLRQIVLLHEELEALRLADYKGLSQEQAAESMGVSRSTFQRIISKARRQVALALSEGHAIKMEGGNFEVAHPGTRGPRK